MNSTRAFCLLLLLSLTTSSESAEKRPNLVFIFADDLGWTDVGCFGSKYYETPNIDRLCQSGMKMTDAYTCGPNCAPTRACLMSGQYSPRHGIYTVSTGARGKAKFRKLIPVDNLRKLNLKIRTMADALTDAGYVTGMFGKWHLGVDAEHHPSARGFQTAIQSNGRHFNFRTNPKHEVKKGEYLADFLTDRAEEFIEANKSKPFFLYLPHFAVHTPIHAKDSLTAKFEKKKSVRGHKNPRYAAMIASVDESVGRIVKKLDDLNLRKNTLVIFTSDNGGVGGYARAGVKGTRDITNNAPLRGGKGMLYEGGFRVPTIFNWPGVIKEGSACDTPVISVDFYPTFMELAGGMKKKGQILDGTSLVPLVKSSGKAKLERDAIYWHFPGYLQGNVQMGSWRTTPAGAIRSGDYKLIEFFETGKVELYNLKKDIGEKVDLSEKMKEKTTELHDKLKAWRKRVNAPMPMKK